MQMTVAMVAGVVVGIVVAIALKKVPTVAAWVALVFGTFGLLITAGGFFPGFPELGRAGILLMGLLPVIGLVVALSCVLRGERKALNWAALIVAAVPVGFWIFFFVAELISPHA